MDTTTEAWASERIAMCYVVGLGGLSEISRDYYGEDLGLWLILVYIWEVCTLYRVLFWWYGRVGIMGTLIGWVGGGDVSKHTEMFPSLVSKIHIYTRIDIETIILCIREPTINGPYSYITSGSIRQSTSRPKLHTPNPRSIAMRPNRSLIYNSQVITSKG